MVAYLLLGLGQALGLFLTLLGWHGVWVQLAAAALFTWLSGFEAIGAVPLGLLFAIALVAEFVSLVAGGRSEELASIKRVGFAGLAGGAAGAALGLFVPLLGTLFGALAGALLGTAIACIVFRGAAEWRIIPGQVIAVGVQSATGVIVAVFLLLSLIR